MRDVSRGTLEEAPKEIDEERRYPFGRKLTRRPPSADGQRALFVLGAYPSALHVEWKPASGKRVRAIPIDDEPEPFWNGIDATERVAAWLDWLQPSPSLHGTFRTPPRLNGSSGAWVDTMVLEPLGYDRSSTWITDCLDTYRMSTGVAARIKDTYDAADLPSCHLDPHPSEKAIVQEALALHSSRLLAELHQSRPDTIATLGNAAARVFAELVGLPQQKLSPDPYGIVRIVDVSGREVRWYPLAHPAAPEAYQAAHADWVRKASA